MELVTQLRVEQVLQAEVVSGKVPEGPRNSATVYLSKPFIVRAVTIPMQQGQNIHIQTTAQCMPLVMKMQQPELPIDPEDIWVMTTASKASSDEYLQQTSGILIGKH
jgi:hypothetical protein